MNRVLNCVVNGQAVSWQVEEGTSLLEALRDHGLTGAKQGCGVGECGACTVLLDDRPVTSCLILALQAEGCHIRTVEGEAANGPSQVQQALIDAGAVQCGFCTPGMVMTATALVEELRAHPEKPRDRETLRRAVAGNLCRCTGYDPVIQAVEQCLGKPE